MGRGTAGYVKLSAYLIIIVFKIAGLDVFLIPYSNLSDQPRTRSLQFYNGYNISSILSKLEPSWRLISFCYHR